MLILIAVIICAIGFGLWFWYEMTHAIEIDIDGKKSQFDKEHAEAVEFRSTAKC